MHSIRRALTSGLLVGIGAVSTMSLSAQAVDPVIGTWNLNLAKSKYSPGPAPKSSTVTFEVAGKGIKVTTKGVGADGSPTATDYTAEYDGKDYPMNGSPIADMVSLKRIDARTVTRTDKKAGKVVQTLTRVVSADGKTLTVTTIATNAQGNTINNVAVYDRQ